MLTREENRILAEEISQYIHDPLGFVLFAFEWGTGELREFTEPDDWQVARLNAIGEKLKQGEIQAQEAIQIAVSSGHGIGKSALVSWLILWAMCTFPDTKGVVTANTETQLKTKTWAELAKWYRLCICKDWFEYTATALFSKEVGHEKTWRIDMVAWSERNTEAFAGLHNKNNRILIIFDEASAIPDIIWEVTEGALTDEDTEIIWCCFGNPTRNTGRFRECFGKFAHRWDTVQVDSRTAKMTNKTQLKAWVDDYGEDSDFVRVRVRGEFPKAGSNQLISSDLVHKARGLHLDAHIYNHAAIVMGVDVARFGDDRTVFYYRQGLATIRPMEVYRGLDTQQIASLVAAKANEINPDGIIVDGTGVGAGVVDRLNTLRVPNVIDAIVGSSAIDSQVYVNRRIEMWVKCEQWLKAGGSIPDDPELAEELCVPEYFYNAKEKMQLESKDDIKKRGLSSPDKAEALCLTFYEPVNKRSNIIPQKKTQSAKQRVWG